MLPLHLDTDSAQIVRARYLAITQPPPMSALDAARAVTHQLPSAAPPVRQAQGEPGEDAEQVLNRLDSGIIDDSVEPAGEVAVKPFHIPQPPPLSRAEVDQCMLCLFVVCAFMI